MLFFTIIILALQMLTTAHADPLWRYVDDNSELKVLSDAPGAYKEFAGYCLRAGGSDPPNYSFGYGYTKPSCWQKCIKENKMACEFSYQGQCSFTEAYIGSGSADYYCFVRKMPMVTLKSGKQLTMCPPSHPHVYDYGERCCKTKKACDGSGITWTSSCCDASARCSEKQCDDYAAPKGNWNNWSSYGPCSHQCRGGFSTRKRTCQMKSGESMCEGKSVESKYCYECDRGDNSEPKGLSGNSH